MRQVLRKTGFFLYGFLVMGLVAVGSAQAVLLFDWNYKNSSFDVGPMDVIPLEATLNVSTESTEDLIGSNFLISTFCGHSDPLLNILTPYSFNGGADFHGTTINLNPAVGLCVE